MFHSMFVLFSLCFNVLENTKLIYSQKNYTRSCASNASNAKIKGPGSSLISFLSHKLSVHILYLILVILFPLTTDITKNKLCSLTVRFALSFCMVCILKA